eukprot:363332-Chlamydomonas_euryale.AAC.1
MCGRTGTHTSSSSQWASTPYLSIEHVFPDRCQMPARVRSDMDELPAPPVPHTAGGGGGARPPDMAYLTWLT